MADYVLEGLKWGSPTFGAPGGNLTWAVDGTIPSYFVPQIAAALTKWSTVGNISFTQVNSTATANLDFTLGSIDGPGNTQGRANYSFSGATFQSAVVTFDVAENWHPAGASVVSDQGANLLLIATHEIGHAIGLDHYNAGPAIMNSVLTPAVTGLTQSDIDGIIAIYGAVGTQTAHQSDAFRFFDTHDGGHFFTTSVTERDAVLATRPDLAFEGVGFKAFDNASVSGTAAVYRFFDTHDGGHFFTASVPERDQVLATRPDLKFEGVGYYEFAASQGASSDPVYRFFDRHDGGHFFTSSVAERDQVIATRPDLAFEGIAFYAPHPGVEFVV